MRIKMRKNAMLSLALAVLMLVMLVPVRAQAATTRDIPISITWTTTDDTKIPASLKITLTQRGPNGTVSNYRTTTLQKTSFPGATLWTGVFTNVPDTTVAGTPYTYSVAWPSVTGFDLLASTAVSWDGTATAQYRYGTAIPATFNVVVNWTGEPASPPYAGRPTSVRVQLMNAKTSAGNNPAQNITGGSTDATWNGSFTGITGAVTQGTPVQLQVVSPPAGYVVSYAFNGTDTFTVTLAYNSDFSGTVTWYNAPRFNKPGLYITVGVAGTTQYDIIHHFSRTDEDVLSFTVSGLTAGQTYVIKSVSINRTIADDLNYADPTWSGHNISIGRKSGALMRIGVSMRWVDNNNKRERRPNETTVYLFRDGAYTGDAVQIRESDGWYAIFYDQPYSDSTHVYSYSVRAAKIPHYWSRGTRLSSIEYRITQFYGRGLSDTTSSATAPKVGDPTLFRTPLTDRMYAEAAASAKAVAAAARLNDGENVGGAVDFTTLKRINKDIVAWLTIEGTDVDYPIVRGKDNSEYLTRLFSGEANSAGSLFMDYHNSTRFENRSTTVYGHNMKDGTMFASLLQYRNQSYYDAHASFTLQTPNGDYTVEPIAGFFTDAAYSNVVKRTFANNQAFMTYVDRCMRASDFQSNATVSPTDKLITFVTCSDDYNDGRRYLLVCKLSPA